MDHQHPAQIGRDTFPASNSIHTPAPTGGIVNWPAPVPAYGAQGRGGQFIIVIPDKQMVAVVTGWNEGPLGEQAYDMLKRYILPADAKLR